MNRLNVEEATREELIAVVKQLYQQLRQQRTSSERVKELEKQVEQLKQKLREKESAVQDLAKQNAIFSEKSVADEETISVLIKQLEEMNVGDNNQAFSDDIVEARAVPAKAAPSSPREKWTTGGKVVQALVKGSGGGGSGVTEGARGDSSTAFNAATIIAQKNNELAILEKKVRELTEVNTFYTAIVLRHDEEQIQGVLKDSLSKKEPSAVTDIEITSLHERIGFLENERDNLQRVVRQQNQEKQVLMKELQEHREELSRLELDLVAAERWKVSLATPSETVEGMPSVHISSSVQSEEFSPLRASAQLVDQIQHKNKRGKSTLNIPTRPRATDSPVDTHTPPRNLAIGRSPHYLDTLPEIRLWNPSKQEKILLERVELYRKCIDEMQAFELDRQRGFDEIERARAELFTEMNTKLEEQRREIYRLNKRIAESVSVCRKEEEKKNLEQRPVNDVVTSPIVDSLQDEHVSMPSCEAFSSVSAGVNRMLRKEGAEYDHAEKKAREGNDYIDGEDVNVVKEVLLEFLGAAAASSEMSVPGKEEVEMAEEKQLTKFGGDDEDVNKQDSPLEAETDGLQEIYDSSLPKVDWAWKLMDMAEEIGRLGIYCEEGEEAVGMSLRSRSATAALVAGLTVQVAESSKKMEVLETALVEMRVSVSSLEGRERELVAEVGRLQEEMTSMMEADKVKKKLTAKREVFTPSLTDVACTEEPWEPLQCVCQAYSEVVNAQIALLRAASAIVAVPKISDEEFENFCKALDAIVTKDDRVNNGINEKDGRGIPSSFKFVEEEGSEKQLGRKSSPLKTAPLQSSETSTFYIKHSPGLFSAPMATSGSGKKNAQTGNHYLFSEFPSTQAADPQSETSGFCLDKSPAAFYFTLESENENDKRSPPPADAAGSSPQETYPAFFAEKHSHKASNAAPNRSIASPLGSESPGRFAPDPLDYFVKSREMGKDTQRDGSVHGNATNVKNFLDLFGAAPSEESHSKQGGDNNAFVAEFDPFA
ncbi:hypothetical protein C3747_21g326 [Trypanosoma cruzi]|uniref:Uncharacterized protein n=2 Tax=Trypanosoma cruzi TaxID=5693 RepID=Q4D660_TRYCC|nr:hypothetical protein, conserved [Trypanosoma cruzi]EAN88008.1 hypothetical protein, conserved [Trypanosoma cruzi]PWV16844.1 hypothetical protein C3747_21g326 [Trypanosoma cruzi]RNC43814.1 hypothetical protein TcCL_NonESM06514 [Trypanosoma cruzi]|eukprot:XP_809859.1 hypothetical protein [Trypanosoma cruzi strain CL Brener]